mgnify:CR=1 FL=1
MSKFVIECPSCGKPAEANTGFFAKKRIFCKCGYVIDVNTDKITSKRCPHCENVFAFDQSKNSNAECPICHTKVSSMKSKQPLVDFICKQCGATLSATKGADRFVCPICDFDNDVQERIAAGSFGKEGLVSIIKYEGDNDTFVWKHPLEDFKYGSQLIVHESQEAIFFKDGQALDLFGPGRYTLETQQLPLLEKLYKLPTDSDRTFHSEVYFINKTVQMAVKWGTPDKVRFIDPLTGVPLQLGASGTLNLMVKDSRNLLVKLVGTMKGIAWSDSEGFAKSLSDSFRPLISNAVKTNLPDVIKNEAIDILEIDSYLDVISENLKNKLIDGFEEYGMTIPQLYVTSVVLPEEDPNFKRIRELHTITLQTRVYQAEATVKTAQAQSQAQYRTAEEQSRAAIEVARRDAELQKQTTETEITKREAERTVIKAEAEAKASRIAGLTEAEVMRAKGYNEKDVLQAEVQKAYAEGIGNMGPDVASGGGGGGIAGDMMGVGVGLAMANAIAPQIGNMMQGMNPKTESSKDSTAETNIYLWDCSCGQKNNSGNYCSNCGAPRKTPNVEDGWNCVCGNRGIIGNFCSNCGRKRGDNQ